MSARDLASQPSGVTLRYGIVKVAPVDELSELTFVYRGESLQSSGIDTSYWLPRGAELPEVGDPCIVAVSPNVDPFIQSWRRK